MSDIWRERNEELRILKTELQNECCQNANSMIEGHPTYNALDNVNQKIVELENEETQSAMLRSRCKWQKLGEKNSSYFLALEKRRYFDKTCYSLFINGKLCTNQTKILKEQRRFYQELYTANREICFDIANETGVRISKEEQTMLDSPITMKELFTATNSMKRNKVPGIDGISLEFYLKFWEYIKHPLWNMYQEVLSKGIFGRTTRTGLISLLPKKSKDTRRLQNLRPLAILNLDYKVIAKLLAS